LHRIEYYQDTFEGDKFNIAIPGGQRGEATLKDNKLVWVENKQEVVTPSKIAKHRSEVCAVWTNTLVGEEDGNCCMAFILDGNEQVLCEVSHFCIVRAKKMVAFIINECRAGQTAESGVSPKFKSDKPF